MNVSYSAEQSEVFFGSDAKYTFVKKGRRFGFTHAAMNFIIESMVEGKDEGIRVLWGDTINENIRKYYERYATPLLDQLPNSAYSYNLVSKVLKIGKSVCDFRSADNPKNWEGFGYDIIILNETGIILDDPYLFDNAVVPMMLDNPNSRLWGGGAPKGKTDKRGKKKKNFELWEMTQSGDPQYKGYSFTSYESFCKTKAIRKARNAQIDKLRDTLPPAVFAQEIMAEFIDVQSGMVFKPAIVATEHPPNLRYYIGSDLAYSSDEKADFSVVVVIGIDILTGVSYVIHVERWQAEIAHTIARLKAIQQIYKEPIAVEANGPQKAVADMVENAGIQITRLYPTNDKLTRALSFALEWNGGKVVVMNNHWTDAFTAELVGFTGNGKETDDQVDAAVHAYNSIGLTPIFTF